MSIYIAGAEYTGLYIAGANYTRLLEGGDAYVEPSTPPSPDHEFSITAGGSGSTIGYNQPGGWGSIASGSFTFTPPGGSSRTIVMCRNLRTSILIVTFSDQNVPIAEFPDRVVATRGTNECVFNAADSVRNISSGTRMDMPLESGTISQVFASGQEIEFDFYYD